jgi:TfoX/Sxy family transcriptional regulator of competence genes
VAYDESLAERVRGVMAAAGGSVEEKKMFGGLCFMLNGQMCCGVMKEDLIVKLEPDASLVFAEQANVRLFDFSGRPMAGMLYVSPGALQTDAALEKWIQRGVEYVVKHPKSAAKPKSRSKR